jgi:hypothetical protein
MARVSPAASDGGGDVAHAKDQKATKSEQPMDVDEGEDGGEDEEEYEIAAILDAKKGSFPQV